VFKVCMQMDLIRGRGSLLDPSLANYIVSVGHPTNTANTSLLDALNIDIYWKTMEYRFWQSVDLSSNEKHQDRERYIQHLFSMRSQILVATETLDEASIVQNQYYDSERLGPSPFLEKMSRMAWHRERVGGEYSECEVPEELVQIFTTTRAQLGIRKEEALKKSNTPTPILDKYLRLMTDAERIMQLRSTNPLFSYQLVNRLIYMCMAVDHARHWLGGLSFLDAQLNTYIADRNKTQPSKVQWDIPTSNVRKAEAYSIAIYWMTIKEQFWKAGLNPDDNNNDKKGSLIVLAHRRETFIRLLKKTRSRIESSIPERKEPWPHDQLFDQEPSLVYDETRPDDLLLDAKCHEEAVPVEQLILQCLEEENDSQLMLARELTSENPRFLKGGDDGHILSIATGLDSALDLESRLALCVLSAQSIGCSATNEKTHPDASMFNTGEVTNASMFNAGEPL
jgi:hypothetical protein